MIHSRWQALAAALVVTGALACGNERISDATISESVANRLEAEPMLSAFDIEVETENGIVTLDGRVVAPDQKAEAERVARATAGVQGVSNLIEIGSSAVTPAPTPPVGAPPSAAPDTAD